VRPPRPRSILLATAGIAAILVLGEWVVRTTLESPSVTVPVARFGWAYPPFARVVHSSEGYSVRHTNSLGLFDRELRVPRPARRVVLLGDSYAEALQVPEGQGFADVAERLLPGTEIVDAGVSGHSPLDHAEWLETTGDSLAPDVIVVEISDANLDLMLTPDALRRYGSPPVPGAPAVVPPEKGLRGLVRWVLRHSALATVSWRRLKLLAAEQKGALSRRFNATVAARRARPQAAAIADPRLPAMLDSLHTRIARHARHVVYLYIPHLDYFAPGVPESDPALGRLLADLAHRRGATLLDAAGAMRAEFLRTGQPVHGFANSVMGSGHINAAGHRVVGEALARVLAELGP
jgi:lysophospholipase L1-like esterase